MADQVLNFLQHHNRPFTVNEILQGLGEKLGKTKVQKILDQLVIDNKVLEKTYGKQKIYCVKQPENPSGQINEQILKVDRQINEISSNLRDVEKELREKEPKVTGTNKTLSVTEALGMKNALKAEIDDLQQQLNAIQSKNQTFTDEERTEIIRNHDRLVKEYKKRKRLCLDIFDAIYENYPKSKKQLLQEIGLETDEDVGFALQNP